MANVIEILDVDPEELGFEEDGANVDLDSQRKGALNFFLMPQVSFAHDREAVVVEWVSALQSCVLTNAQSRGFKSEHFPFTFPMKIGFVSHERLG